jgi:hypothetical protein
MFNNLRSDSAKVKPNGKPRLERATFTTSRLLDYCSEKSLTLEIGHGRDEWPLVVLKELMDNALDACEDVGIAPEIAVTVNDGGITVTDNGPGIPAETVAAVLDFSRRVSSREHYVSPTRFEGRFATTAKGGLSEFLQKTVGDAVFNCPKGKIWAAEIKTEASSRHGKFFLETWSNKCFGRQTNGWMRDLRTDILMYFFQDVRRLYSIPFCRLWEWAWVYQNERGWPGRIHDFPEKKQRKYQQQNETWGCCVPITVIAKEVGFRAYDLQGDSFREARRMEELAG